MNKCSLVLPVDFDDYAWEVQAKGFFPDALMLVSETRYRLTFYDPVRLSQEIDNQLQSEVAFSELNLVIVRSVTRANMEAAVSMLARSSPGTILVPD
jgi:hypothetical protein